MEMILSFLESYGLIACFIIITLEYACFPISSEIVLPLAGIVCQRAMVPFFNVWIFSCIGGIIGSLFCYFIGSFGGRKCIIKIKNKFPNTRKGIDKSIERFNKSSILSCMIGRVIPICRTYISFVAGMYKCKLVHFIISSLVGISVWNLLLIGIGYYSYEKIESYQCYYKQYEVLIVLLILVIFFILILYKELKKKIEY